MEPEKKLIVTVQFVVDARADELGEDGDGWDKAMEYCRDMFTAVNYPNRNGDEWYIESVEVDDGSDDADDNPIIILHDPNYPQVLELTPSDSAWLMQKLDEPAAAPTEAMIRASQRRRELLGE